MKKQQLYSGPITQKLIVTLKLSIVPLLIVGGLSIFAQVEPSINNDNTFTLLLGLGALVYLLVLLFLVIFTLRWVYMIHKDLKRMDEDYLFTPGQALLAFMVPVYSIWGIWNCLNTMQKYFKTMDARAFGMNMYQLINLLYIGWILSLGTSLATKNYYENGGVAVEVISTLADVASWLALFGIVLIMKHNLSSKNLTLTSRISETVDYEK